MISRNPYKTALQESVYPVEFTAPAGFFPPEGKVHQLRSSLGMLGGLLRILSLIPEVKQDQQVAALFLSAERALAQLQEDGEAWVAVYRQIETMEQSQTPLQSESKSPSPSPSS